MYRGLLAFLVLLLSCPHFGGAVAQPGPLLSVTHSAWDLNVTIEAEPTEQNTYPFRTCVFTPGDGSAGVAGCTIRYAYASPGVYNATLDVYDTMGRLSTTPLTFILPEEPRPRITREGLAIVATLESHPSVAHMRSIVWRWGDDTTSTGVRGSHIYAQEGVYDLEVEVDYGTGIPTVYRTSLIVPLPKLVVSVEPDGLMVRCAVTSEPPGLLRDFRWDFGDGRPATGPGGTRNYSKPGTYDIRVEAKDAWGWTYWTTHRVHVRPSGFNVTSEGLDVSTTATGIRNMTGLFLEWDWGDGSARSSGPNSFHRYSASGRYSIDLYVYDSTGLLTTVPGEVHVALETDVPPQEAGRAEGSVNQESQPWSSLPDDWRSPALPIKTAQEPEEVKDGPPAWVSVVRVQFQRSMDYVRTGEGTVVVIFGFLGIVATLMAAWLTPAHVARPIPWRRRRKHPLSSEGSAPGRREGWSGEGKGSTPPPSRNPSPELSRPSLDEQEGHHG